MNSSAADQVVAAASAALGRPLTGPIPAGGGGGLSLVLRCQDLAGGDGSVIVKSYPATADGASSFAAEAAGLAVAGDTGMAPRLLAADAGTRTVVMSDLGTGASLADLLLGDSAQAARAAFIEWARGCGRLAVLSSDRQAQFERLLTSRQVGQSDEGEVARLAGRVRGAAQRAELLGVGAPAGLDADLAEVAMAAESREYALFSAGDICPDNNLVTRRGIRFLDFESAGFHSVFLDAAYIRMPFSTCWCVFRLPAGLAEQGEAAYRQQACLVHPRLAGDGIWRRGVRLAVAAWTMSSMWWLLDASLEADAPLDPDLPSPGSRQLMRHRWQTLRSELAAGDELPALAGLAQALLAATEHWQAAGLPLYPALRSAYDRT